jgi:hypothetical protein
MEDEQSGPGRRRLRLREKAADRTADRLESHPLFGHLISHSVWLWLSLDKLGMTIWLWLSLDELGMTMGGEDGSTKSLQQRPVAIGEGAFLLVTPALELLLEVDRLVNPLKLADIYQPQRPTRMRIRRPGFTR